MLDAAGIEPVPAVRVCASPTAIDAWIADAPEETFDDHVAVRIAPDDLLVLLGGDFDLDGLDDDHAIALDDDGWGVFELETVLLATLIDWELNVDDVSQGSLYGVPIKVVPAGEDESLVVVPLPLAAELQTRLAAAGIDLEGEVE